MVTLGHLLYNRPADPDDRDHLQKWSHWVTLFAKGWPIRMIQVICKKKFRILCGTGRLIWMSGLFPKLMVVVLSSLQEKKRNEDVELPGRTACY